ncbi:carbohydrate ABC transporter permease [Streptomyces sp. NBC_00117]|uniref:carbohydrate ABC transporter permease n=1 Tax=unclassified Streptomyces TaxID=2593676 RepID=UPI002259045F|nr:MULTISPECIES: carbohydrate ABC transporter permease [unclassified Streptomyces]MCX5435689.1 carbohydrate ABC transporter permease [Streptomyces sp. NBC_00063]
MNTLLDPAPKSKTAPTPTQSEPRGRRNRLRGPRVALYALLIAGALEALVPILWVLSGSLQSAKQLYKGTDPIPHPFEWGNFATAWNEGGFSQYLPNSLLYTAAAVLGILVIASLAGYALARIEFPGRGAVVGFILVIMIIPMPASFIAQYKLLITLGLANTRIGYILVLIAGGLPISILIMRGFFASQPKELEEAAAIDGASLLGTFWRIILPLAKPGLIAVAVIQAMGVWNEYLMGLVLFNDSSLMPVQRGLTNFVSADSPQQQILLAASVIAVLPIVIFYAIAQRHIISGLSAGALK